MRKKGWRKRENLARPTHKPDGRKKKSQPGTHNVQKRERGRERAKARNSSRHVLPYVLSACKCIIVKVVNNRWQHCFVVFNLIVLDNVRANIATFFR